MRRKHVLTRIRKLSYPRRLIFLDSESAVTSVQPAGTGKVVKAEKHVFKLASACFVKLNDELEVEREEWGVFREPEAVHDFIKQRVDLKNKKPLFIFAHNFHFDFPVLQLYRLASQGFALSKAVFDSDVFFIKMKYLGRVSVYFVDSTNFFKTSISELGKLINLEKLSVDFEKAGDEELVEYNMRDVEILKNTVLNLLRFLKTHGLPFRLTLAGLAFAGFRARFMNHQIEIHSDGFAEALERESYYGGRNEAFRLGRIENISVYDFNSLYPFVMRTYPVPVKLVKTYDSISVPQARRLLEQGFLLISEAWLDADKPYYPYRSEDKLLFPTGRFKTVLPTPELEIALTENHVRKLGRTCVYEGSVVFKDYVDFFYSLRLKYKREGNNVYQYMAKILLNSLYGKFAQRVRELVYVRDVEPEVFEVEDVYIADEDRRIIRKRLLGKEFVLEETDRLSFNSFTAIAAHITSYARRELLRAVEAAGWGNVYYVDTDSLFVNSEGAERLVKAGLVDSAELGKLKHEYTADVEIRGCKDYTVFINGEKLEKIKGVNKKAQHLGGNKYLTLRFNRFNSLLRKRSRDAVIVEYVVKELLRNYDKGIVGEDGSVRPFQLHMF